MVTLAYNSLAVSNSRVINPKSDLVVGSGNGGFLVVLLLETLFGDWTFSRVKIQNVTMMVRSDNDNIRAMLPF
jgi:hypothetical protein